ncbi:MAG: isopeptide-forming domain-containing fimbrial protein [Clostridiales bacterium]|nr:isopeptide-forming domain-containing fimbrial protein [Clostridiales bacterium]
MKKMKKLFAILMTMAMVMGMNMTVFALPANTTANITINNAGTGAKFNYVQIVVANPETETGWDIKTDYEDEFATAFNNMDEQEILKGMINKATGDKGTPIEDFDSKYAAALDAICGTIPAPTAQTQQTSPITVNAAGVYVIRGYEEGYNYGTMAGYVAFGPYDQTTGVPTDLQDTTVEAKKSPTTITKSSDDKDKAVEIGRDVTYTVTSTVPYIPTTDSNRYYVIADQITGADYKLETDGKLKVHVVIGETKPYALEQDVYVDCIEQGDTQKFVLDLTSLLLEKQEDNETVKINDYANKKITLTYVATVTDMLVNNTVAAGDGENMTTPDYGSDNDKLVSGTVTLTKKNDDETPVVLEGAEFVLKKNMSKSTDPEDAEYVYATIEDGVLTGWVDDKEDATTLTTDEDGTIVVNGLEKDGKYSFEETKAPEGYTINETDATITWGNVPTDLDTPVTGTSEMTDTKLTALPLPGTGGMGTTLFTIAGCVIMISAAGLFFATRKKAN